MSGVTVVYDACVLYPAPLRDFLMHLAVTDLFRARWTDAIHDEWIRNVLSNRPDIHPEQLERTRMLMNAHVQQCLISGYEFLIPTLTLPDSGDRHVLAAAIHGKAEIILTFNRKDFPDELLSPYGIRAVSPDVFILRQLEHASGQVCLAAKRHRQSLRKPPKDPGQYLDTLANQGLPQTADALGELIAVI